MEIQALIEATPSNEVESVVVLVVGSRCDVKPQFKGTKVKAILNQRKLKTKETQIEVFDWPKLLR